MKSFFKVSNVFFLFSFGVWVQGIAQVKTVGSMSEMGKNQFAPTIALDTLASRKKLIGLGPLGRMEGEITVLNGKALGARVQADGQGSVSNIWQVEAPFFVYAKVDKWKNKNVNWAINNVDELQTKLEEAAIRQGISLEEAFPFRLKGTFSVMKTHIVMPRSPEIEGYQVGKNQTDYTFTDIEGEIVGFYSAKHAGIFTSKTSRLHIHFIGKNEKIMGHINALKWSERDMKLALPR